MLATSLPVVGLHTRRRGRSRRGWAVALAGAHAGALAIEQAALALDAPAVARQRAVAPHDAMAGNRDGQRCSRRRPAPRPAPHLGAPMRCRNLAVAGRRARAESAAAPATRAAERPCRARRAAGRVRAPALRRSRSPSRRSARTRHRRRQASRAESDPGDRARGASGSSPSRMAHTPFALRATRIEPSEHSPTAKRISMSGTAGAVVGRRHAQHLVGRLVEASAEVEAGIVDGFGHGLARLRELVADACRPMRRGIGPGRDAGDGLEHPVKVIRTQARALRQCRETRRRVRGFDHAADLGDRFRTDLLERRFIRLATAASPETGPLSVGCGPMEAHVLRIRQT